MPIFEIECKDCGNVSEVLVLRSDEVMTCPVCGSPHSSKWMSATSSLTGREKQTLPGAQDTACCGSRPGQATGCSGPGSCCGKN